jgi:hypothetical protein
MFLDGDMSPGEVAPPRRAPQAPRPSNLRSNPLISGTKPLPPISRVGSNGLRRSLPRRAAALEEEDTLAQARDCLGSPSLHENRPAARSRLFNIQVFMPTNAIISVQLVSELQSEFLFFFAIHSIVVILFIQLNFIILRCV